MCSACLMCMKCVVVGGCNVVAHEGMFLVGCCSWLRSILDSNQMLYYKKADVLTAILQSSSEHTQHTVKTFGLL